MPRRIKKHLINTRRRKYYGGGKKKVSKKGGGTKRKVGGSVKESSTPTPKSTAEPNINDGGEAVTPEEIWDSWIAQSKRDYVNQGTTTAPAHANEDANEDANEEAKAAIRKFAGTVDETEKKFEEFAGTVDEAKKKLEEFASLGVDDQEEDAMVNVQETFNKAITDDNMVEGNQKEEGINNAATVFINALADIHNAVADFKRATSDFAAAKDQRLKALKQVKMAVLDAYAFLTRLDMPQK